jgi:hypothetical protein
MVNLDPAHAAQWRNELRLGMHRSVAFYRGKLRGEHLNELDRQGIIDLLDLLEDYMTLTWPVNDK